MVASRAWPRCLQAAAVARRARTLDASAGRIAIENARSNGVGPLGRPGDQVSATGEDGRCLARVQTLALAQARQGDGEFGGRRIGARDRGAATPDRHPRNMGQVRPFLVRQ